MFWQRKCECPVPPTSPARALAESLTSPDTRDEWRREYGTIFSRIYINEKRDIRISQSVVLDGDLGEVRTPFTLNQAEMRIVTEAMRQFDRRDEAKREAAALRRLTAASIEAGTDETPKSGSARRAKAGNAAKRSKS